MKALDQYRFLAELHWRTWLPRRVAELERTGRLRARLDEAARRTASDLADLREHFLQQGLTAKQAHERAWEIVRERYIFLPPEP